MTIQQAAERCKVHRDTISRAIKQGALNACKVQGKFREEYRIKEDDLTAWQQAAGHNLVTMPVAQYAELQGALQATTGLVVRVMDELRTMQNTQAAILQHIEQQDAKYETRLEERDQRLVEVMRRLMEEKQEEEARKKRPGLVARVVKRLFG